MQVLLLMMLEHQLQPSLKTIVIKVQSTYNLILQNIPERQGYIVDQFLSTFPDDGSSPRGDTLGFK